MDKSIFAAAKEGSQEAVEKIFERYKGIVLACANKYYLRGADRDDVVQEGLIALYQAILTYDNKRPFGRYAKICVNRRVCSAVTAHTRNKHLALNTAARLDQPAFTSDEDGALLIERVASNAVDPCFLVAEKSIVENITEVAKNALSPTEWEVLNLFAEGRTYPEIANVLGIGRKSVDNALQRARKKLKRELPGLLAVS